MTKAFDTGYTLGIAAAHANPHVIDGLTDFPACPFKGAAKMNAFYYGFKDGFRSIANDRRAA